MRRVERADLPRTAAQYLDKRQARAVQALGQGSFDGNADWKAARQTRSMAAVLATLHAMVGPRQRCMYCQDSHGSDIEHFRPKAVYPRFMYQWKNMLLCCTHCGRLKGNQFPMQGRRTLLIDPTREDPWKSLDFDPVTGNICARFDAVTQSWSNKGEKTVEVLQLDKREALAAGYLKTWRRLSEAVQEALGQIEPNPEVLITKLQAADDHHLLSWCFGDRGSACEPLSTLRRQHPALWARCVQALKS